MKLLSGLAAATVLWVLHARLGPVPASWVYDRTAVEAGETWRFLTAHLVHVDGAHAVWNGLGLALIVVVVGELDARLLALFAGAAAAAIGASLLLLAPTIDGYCGASGILSGVFTGGLTALWLRSHEPLYLVALALWSAKIVAELLVGGSFVLDSAWPSWPGAHVAGALAGIAAAATYERRSLRAATLARLEHECTG